MIHFVIVGILTIASTYLVFMGLTNAELLPTQASEQAISIDKLFDVQWFFIAFFFSLIIVFMVYSFVVFRRKKGEEGDGDHFEGHSGLEIVWTAVPLAIVIFLANMGANTLGEVESRDPDAMIINVTAAQWAWSFEYPDSGIVSDILVLPVDQQILLRMISRDVIHSFWVPEFRVKQDVLPGGDDFIRELRITPNKLGNYKVRCAELCGLDHTNMRADVEVLSVPAFDQWVTKETTECTLPEAACRGQELAIEFGCIGCHTQDSSSGGVGPAWGGLFGSDVPLADGTTVTADEAYLSTAIQSPNAQIRDGYGENIMPQNFGDLLSDSQINDLIAFIQTLGE